MSCDGDVVSNSQCLSFFSFFLIICMLCSLERRKNQTRSCFIFSLSQTVSFWGVHLFFSSCAVRHALRGTFGFEASSFRCVLHTIAILRREAEHFRTSQCEGSRERDSYTRKFSLGSLTRYSSTVLPVYRRSIYFARDRYLCSVRCAETEATISAGRQHMQPRPVGALQASDTSLRGHGHRPAARFTAGHQGRFKARSSQRTKAV